MKKSAEFDFRGTRKTAEVAIENKKTVWVRLNINFKRLLIKRHKAKHDVVFI